MTTASMRKVKAASLAGMAAVLVLLSAGCIDTGAGEDGDNGGVVEDGGGDDGGGDDGD